MTRAEQDLQDTKRAVRQRFHENPHLAQAARARARDRMEGFSTAAFPDAGRWAWTWVTGFCILMFSIGLMIALSGCTVIEADYVRADRLTYKAIAPVHSGYTEADPKLSAGAKERRYRLLRSWDARLKEAESE